MRFSLNFIKEFLDVSVEADTLARTLTMAGIEVEGWHKAGDDWVFDIEVTSNRYDWLSILGIAREIAAVSGKNIRINPPAIITKPALEERKIIIEDKSDCPVYIGRSLKNVKITEAPLALTNLISACGINSINNVVDVTNYCMLKWGNPLHAFDEDKLEGDVYIRRAKSGEKFIGIDEKERLLKGDNLVIADSKKIIALAGVIGAKNSEIDANTKNVFLEAAIFSPLAIRHSRRLLGIDTDSSYRFERQVYAGNLIYASQEASNLIEELAGAKFFGYKKAGIQLQAKPKKINLSLDNLNKYIGLQFSVAKIKQILKALGFTTKQSSKGSLKICVPAFRFDISRDVDIYEEVSRIYGYEKIPAQIPSLSMQRLDSSLYDFKNEIRDFLCSLNLKEIVTYSIVAEEELKYLKEPSYILLTNPLRKQENAMRPSLLLGMVSTLRHNLNRSQTSLRFFEIADIYLPGKQGFYEAPRLAIGFSQDGCDIFTLKGVVMTVLDFFGIKEYELKEENRPNFANSLAVYARQLFLGFLGNLDSQTAGESGIKSGLLYAELDIFSLQKAREPKMYEAYSLFPAIWRDISIVLRKDKKFGDIEPVIKGVDYFSGYKVIDIYKGKNIPSGATAFTLRVFYQSKERTLLSHEIDAIHNHVRENLTRSEGVTLR